jgi:aminomethyltransferase
MAALALYFEMTLTTATPGYTALRESAAWRDVSARGRIRMHGEDRARLLHALCTNHIQSLQPGQGCYAFFLNAQGRILADARVACFEDHLLLDTEPELRTALYQHLERYIIADDVTLDDVTAQTTEIAVEGPQAGAVLGLDLPMWAHTAYGGGWAQRTPAGFALVNAAAPAGLPEATEEDARTVRIEQGRPRYGEEITDRHLVHETGLLEAVHFSKGCYLGQEIVERVRSRGQVHRQLRLVEIDTMTPPAPGAKLTRDGAEAGEIASAAYSPALEKTVALAYLRTPFAAPATPLRLDGVTATVQGPARI